MPYIQSDYFINPYTFIPIPEDEPQRTLVERGDKTGFIECSIEIKSPTFIPNTTKWFKEYDSDKTVIKDHYFYEFYSYDDLTKQGKGAPVNPVIPGSEIRGMVRNIYEQLTNSCFLEVDENNLPYKRTPLPKTPAVLEYNNNDGNWYLCGTTEIIKVNINSSKYMRQGAYINIDSKRNAVATDKGQYILHKNNYINGKKYELAFNKNITGIKEKLEKDDERLTRLKNVIDSYCDSKVNKGERKYYEDYKKRFYSNAPILVYTDGIKKYFSPSCMTKEYFVNKISDILEKQYNHNKCVNIDELCPACRLFGMIGKTGSNTGRVRICDTYEHKNIDFGPETVLPILGTPRISATEFYLCEPDRNALMWNYDYWVKDYGNPNQNIDPDLKQAMPVLAGRKVYWHGEFDKNTSVDKSKMNCSVRPIVKGIFKFKVYFDDLSDCELKKLVFCLNLNGEGIHKIGKGKPIGMGDIKVTADKIMYRNYSFDGNILTANYSEETPSLDFPLDSIAEKILYYTKPMVQEDKSLVAYPTIKNPNKPQIFQWFSSNRGVVNAPEIKVTLPSIAEIIDGTKKVYITKIPENESRFREADAGIPIKNKTLKTKNFELLPAIANKEIPKFIKKDIEEALKIVKEKPIIGPKYKNLLMNFLDETPEGDEWQELLKKARQLESKIRK